MTLTTVGYGDLVPGTGVGKAAAAVFIMLSAVCLALPLSVVVDKLQESFDQQAEGDDGKQADGSSENRKNTKVPMKQTGW